MLSEITKHLKQALTNFNDEDSIILNNTLHKIDKHNFQEIIPDKNKSITFIDGGQAEILSAGNFCLSFIRTAAVTFQNNKKTKQEVKEFYLLTTAVYEVDIYYKSKIFGDKLIDEADLTLSSNDQTIKTGAERAPISKVTAIARRFAELAMANIVDSDFIILDGTLEKTLLNEEIYLLKLKKNTAALAKSSSLFTLSGNSPIILLNKIGLYHPWIYKVNEKTAFVKLNLQAKYVFRFEGDREILPFLLENSNDALFLGYPYGLILADKLARVSNEEQKSLKLQFLLRAENKPIRDYLNTSNAHDILDRL